MSVSPSLMVRLLPFFRILLFSNASIEGSSCSPTFSSRTGWLYWIAVSNSLMKCLSENLISCRWDYFSRFFSHLFAYPWGSIFSVHRCDLWIMIPLSIENSSLGKPAIAHERICTGSPSTLCSSNYPFEAGILSSAAFAIHVSTISARFLVPKNPKYAIIPAEISTSPTSTEYSSLSSFDFYSHLDFSPPSPLINFFALSNFTLQFSISYSSHSW